MYNLPYIFLFGNLTFLLVILAIFEVTFFKDGNRLQTQ